MDRVNGDPNSPELRSSRPTPERHALARISPGMTRRRRTTVPTVFKPTPIKKILKMKVYPGKLFIFSKSVVTARKFESKAAGFRRTLATSRTWLFPALTTVLFRKDVDCTQTWRWSPVSS